MNRLHPILILAVIYLTVFFEAWFDGFRRVLGAQIDFLPALMIYAGLSSGIYTVTIAALCAGLWFDSLSSNPLGASVLPLLMIGLLSYRGREVLSREHFFAPFCMGAVASVLNSLAVLFILLNLGAGPLVGWRYLWQLIVAAVGGGLFMPVCFTIFNFIHGKLEYEPASQPAFREDREIKRGRN